MGSGGEGGGRVGEVENVGYETGGDGVVVQEEVGPGMSAYPKLSNHSEDPARLYPGLLTYPCVYRPTLPSVLDPLKGPQPVTLRTKPRNSGE